MLDKIFKVALPVTLLILVVQAFSPGGIFEFLNPLGMIILGICAYSFGWVVSGYLYDSLGRHNAGYSVARHVAISAVFAVPLVAMIFTPSYLYPYIVGKGFVFRFLSIIATLSTLYIVFTNEEFKPRLTPYLIGSFIFTLALGIATIFSVDSTRSFWSNYERMEGFINVLALFGLLFTVVTLRVTEIEWGKIFKIHMWVSGIVSGIAVLQYFIGTLGIKGLSQLPVLSLCLTQGAGCRVDATLGNSIYLGLYAALTFWIIIYAIFAKRISSNWLNFLAAINLLAVYFSGTRGVWVGMALGLGVLFVSKYWFDGNKKAVAATILGGALFVCVFAGGVIYANKNGIAQDVAIVQRFSSVNTLFARWTIWQMAFESFLQKPVFGWGQENFIHAFNLNYDPAMYGQETYFDHPHNTYLGWLVAGGLVGFLAFLYMLFCAVWGSVKSSLSREENNDLVIPIIFAFFVTYFVHIFFVFDNLTSSLLFVLASAYFGSHLSRGLINVPVFNINYRKFLAGVFVVIFLIINYSVIYKPALANGVVIEAMTFAQRAQSQNPITVLEGTKNLYEKAIKLDTLGNYEIREFYLQKSLEYINLLPQVQDESVKQSIVNVATGALDQFKIQIAQNPFDHRARFMLGLYYLNIKNYDLAIETLQQALALAPNKQIALIYLAKAYILKGDIANSSTYYERAIQITPKNIAGYNQIRLEYIQVLMIANQDERAIKIIQELIPTANREEFNSLVSSMTQIYKARQDLKGIIKILVDANKLDPLNQNFVLWLAQALVESGDYNSAVFTINKLSTSNPEVVAQFMSQLESYMNSQKEKAATAPATSTKTTTKK